MRYKNANTGAIVDSSFVIYGEDWEVVETEEILFNQKGQVITGDEEVPMSQKETEEFIEEEINLEEMTKKELVQFAKDENIEVNEKDTKPVIIEAIVKALN